MPKKNQSSPPPAEKTEEATPRTPEPPSTDTAGGCLIRLYWMVAGYLIAVICGVSIINHHGSFSVVDVVYWLAIGGILVARYVDIHKCQGVRADGEPATMADLKWHAIILLPVAVVAWLVIHFVWLAR